MRRLLACFAVFAGIGLVYSICWSAPAMVEKNLFSQDRKPPSPEAAVSPSQPAKPGMPITNLQLDGVMIQGNIRKALVRLKSQPAGATQKKGQLPYVTVRENQQVSDFRVVKIEPKNIVLEKDGQTFVLSLFSEGKTVVPAAVQQPAPGPGTVMPVTIHPGQQQEAGQGTQPQAPGAPGQPGQPAQPGQPGQPGVVNTADQGIIDPTLTIPPPQQVPTEPESAAGDQGLPPEEEMQ